MRRLTLLATAAAVAGAHDATAAVAAAPVAVGEVSWTEAQCMLRNRKIAFLGDSNSRFHWMTFNWFLDTGKLRVPRGSKIDSKYAFCSNSQALQDLWTLHCSKLEQFGNFVVFS